MNYCDPSNLIILHCARLLLLIDVLFWRVRVYLLSGSLFSPKVVFVLPFKMGNCSRRVSKNLPHSLFLGYGILHWQVKIVCDFLYALGKQSSVVVECFGVFNSPVEKKGVAFQF